jgi:hypothetical protein
VKGKGEMNCYLLKGKRIQWYQHSASWSVTLRKFWELSVPMVVRGNGELEDFF